MKKTAAFLVLTTLAACGTPQEQCISRNTRDLRTVEKLISESQGNLQRGYAIERYQVTVPDWEPCVRYARGTAEDPTPRPVTTTCRTWDTETRSRPRSIDLAQEARQLAQLQAKRKELARNAEAVIAQCRKAYPQ